MPVGAVASAAVDGFEVTVGALLDTAGVVGSRVGVVAELSVAPVAAVGAALPGGAAGAAAVALAGSWQERVAGVADGLARHAAALQAAADAYGAAERAAASALAVER